MLLEAGFDEQHDVVYPASGLKGNLLRLPTIGLSFGVSSIAELQIDGGFYNRLNVTSREAAPLSSLLNFAGDRTHDVEDVVVATKIRMLSETAGRPAFAVRFATRLPNASNESGLGLDTTDFFVSALFGKTVQSIRFVGNAGLGILADPTNATTTERRARPTASRWRAPSGKASKSSAKSTAGSNTRGSGEPPVGTESRGALRVGGRFTRRTVRFDAGVIIGTTSLDPSVGFTAGLTWVFRGFKVP